MTQINPSLPEGFDLDLLNPDLAFSYELARAFVGRQVKLSLEDRIIEYQEIQVGYTKRPAWFPYVSVHTADTDFRVKTLGRGANLESRQLGTDFALVIRDESADEQMGRARLTDLKWDAMRALGQLAGGGTTFRSLEMEKVELIGITPEDTDQNVPWGFAGQILVLGKVHFV